MTKRRHQLPFVLGLALAAFLLLFSFDVFGTSEPLTRELAGFVVHSLPAILILVGLFVGRRSTRAAGWFFLLLAAAALFVFDDPVGRVITSVPLAAIGGLFFAAGRPAPPNELPGTG